MLHYQLNEVGNNKLEKSRDSKSSNSKEVEMEGVWESTVINK